MNFSDFERTFAELVAAFPQREIPTATQLIYWQDLNELDHGLFIVAAQHCRRTCDWFPTIKQLLDAADLWAARVHGIHTPEQAWERVLGTARAWHDGISVRSYFNEPEFDALQRIGGIRTVAIADDIGIAGKRRDFLLAYQRGYEVQVSDARALPLPGAPAGMAQLRDGQAA